MDARKTCIGLRAAACLGAAALGAWAQSDPLVSKFLPRLLADAFAQGPSAAMAGSDPDSLTLMDDSQLRESLEAARLRKAVAQRLAAALAELDTLLAAVRGLDAARPGGNPLRPEVFLGALRAATGSTQVPPPVQALWLGPMGDALCDALLLLYADVEALLKANMPAVLQAQASEAAARKALAERAPEKAGPAPTAVPAALPPAPRPEVASTPPRMKLLLVDDDKAVVTYLTVKLGKHYEIAGTTQPANALSMARTERPDVILCDIDMPGMSGGEVAAALAADPRTAAIPLIYLTALATPQEMHELQGMVSGRPAVSKKARLSELLAHINNATR